VNNNNATLYDYGHQYLLTEQTEHGKEIHQQHQNTYSTKEYAT